jgi:hypothetical protein
MSKMKNLKRVLKKTFLKSEFRPLRSKNEKNVRKYVMRKNTI